jgi:hypothetical protein
LDGNNGVAYGRLALVEMEMTTAWYEHLQRILKAIKEVERYYYFGMWETFFFDNATRERGVSKHCLPVDSAYVDFDVRMMFAVFEEIDEMDIFAVGASVDERGYVYVHLACTEADDALNDGDADKMRAADFPLMTTQQACEFVEANRRRIVYV